MWLRSDAVAAIEALAEAHRVVLGLDLRRYQPDGIVEVAWSSFEPTSAPIADKVAASRQTALAALRRADDDPTVSDFDWVLVTWQEP